MSEISLQQLCEANVADYEALTKHGDDGQCCYCSFWHGKWSSMDEYKKAQRETPERLRASVLDRMRSNFHVGVIAYLDGAPCAWVSVGPLIDFYWAWRRVAQLGAPAKTTAGIPCLTVAPESRGRGLPVQVLDRLKAYGRQRGWTAIEAYPFADDAIAKQGAALKWPGLSKSYEAVGFRRVGDHWLSQPDFQRHLYSFDLEESG